MMAKQKKKIQESSETAEPVAVESATPEDELRATLNEIKNYEGVIGYILRNLSSASINLKDPAKIIDYAMLSSSAFDTGKELSDIFELGEIKSIVVEGKTAKMLCMMAKKNKISFFMTENAKTDKILKKCSRISDS